jgi:hypothetical protein
MLSPFPSAVAVAAAVVVPLRQNRPVQVVYIAISMVLFAVGAVTCLLAYVRALDRSRTDEIGVANLFLLTGPTAPRPLKRTMSLMLALQVAAGLAGAIFGAVGLEETQVNALAFGVLVPMFGLGLNGLWSVRHGQFGPRLQQSVPPSNRRIG